ncbi:MAG: TM0106 family RecB-like putative nuclease [Nostocales cyanobacterium]|nr:MAG: TM0106 family RecB-like putative nuclease [Nostocales cyanobacterium]TAF12827.1 MAG: TM0106 family RecB-like putative nuclease [Nostocales cyanobacterium]
MIINAELLLQYQRCKRRPFLDTHGDDSQRDDPHELLVKVQQDKIAYQKSIIYNLPYLQPDFPQGDWRQAFTATLELMHQGVEYIYRGVLLATYAEEYTLLSRPDLLVKQPGKSCFGDWLYMPVDIQLGKRPKQEYQVAAAFHGEILSAVQESLVAEAGLILRNRDTTYPVDLDKWTPQMLNILAEYIQVLESPEPPELFIARQKCSLCHWYNYCYKSAQSQQHLSLLPGVTPIRYTQLQELSKTSLQTLAQTHPSTLENLIGFDPEIASKLIVQAQSTLTKTPLILPYVEPTTSIINTASIELYFDIEAQPDLNLNYLLGVLVVDRQTNTENFHSLLAENPEQEGLIWQQFLDLVNQYPHAPIYHFCNYEVETIKKLGNLYNTPYTAIHPILTRCVDIYEQLIQNVALPIESYALKAIAKWLGFAWRDSEANGAKCIYWYDQWLETGDRQFLELIQRYNEDDCRATLKVKDWLFNFLKTELINR